MARLTRPRSTQKVASTGRTTCWVMADNCQRCIQAAQPGSSVDRQRREFGALGCGIDPFQRGEAATAAPRLLMGPTAKPSRASVIQLYLARSARL